MVLSLVSVVLLGLFTSSDAGECWERGPDNNLYHVSDFEMEYLKALFYCRQLEPAGKAYLTDIESVAENDFILNLLVTESVADAWIGLFLYSDSGLDNTNFKWANGKDVTYSNWTAGEPSYGGGNEKCAEMRNRLKTEPSIHGKWNDNHCDRPRKAVCKYEDLQS